MHFFTVNALAKFDEQLEMSRSMVVFPVSCLEFEVKDQGEVKVVQI